ncbi:UEV-domain-containing protein [Jaminaea rosea]|uniref:UEV-domain-containing protein n=1 Tax=Jaminaea rosea TaxID=1569628 RepID=A0A316UMD3_9BASI|nr:UEV-domain-containing protein [Jaminaea rosea]PWN25978.1 UEV-domain-containing protein [Jaminaea rosea]
MDRRVIHDWLRSILTPYADSQRTFADVTSLLDGYPSLSPRTDLYISNVGQSSLLLQLHGTLPIQYRNATYNIPVQLWVTRAYPREPPIGFVTPTSTMLVRKTGDVELDGGIETEYAKQWGRKWETKNLVAYVQAAQEAFSQQPPVYAKPATSAAAAAPASTPPPARSATEPKSSSAKAAPAPAPASSSSPAPAASTPGGGGKPPPPLPGQASRAATTPPGQSPREGSAVPPLRPPKPGQAEHSFSSPLQSPRVVSTPGPFHPTQPLAPREQHQYGNHGGAGGAYHPQRAFTVDVNSGAGGYSPQRYAAQQPLPQSPALHQQQQGGWQPPTQGHGYGQGDHAHTEQQQYQQQHQGPQRRFSAHHGDSGPAHYYQQQDAVGSSSSGHHSYGPPPHSNGYASPAPRPPPPAAEYAAGPGAGQAPAPVLTAPPPPAKPRDLLAEDDDEGASNSGPRSNGGGPPGSSVSSAATSGPAPPLPPNPHLQSLHAQLHHHLTSRVHGIHSHFQQKNDSLRLLSSDLDSAPDRIKDEVARLEVVRDLCRVAAEKWEGALGEARSQTAELARRTREREQDDGSERDLILADSIVGSQLMSLISQDMALTDVLYHLARAQEVHASVPGAVLGDLERYLKWVRNLAREQFLKRGLGGKIVGGLEMGGG